MQVLRPKRFGGGGVGWKKAVNKWVNKHLLGGFLLTYKPTYLLDGVGNKTLSKSPMYSLCVEWYLVLMLQTF